MVILYCVRYLQQISLLFVTISAILDYIVVFLWYLAELRDGTAHSGVIVPIPNK